LSKGFQAFLSKPIDIARLDAVIRQWVRDYEKDQMYTGVDTPEDDAEGSDEEEVTLLGGKEIAGLNIENGIRRFRGDEEVYINILHSFSTSTKSLLNSIEKIPEDRLKSYEITVHSIKGSSFGICADAVGRMAADLERAAKDCELGYIKKHNAQFIEVARKLIADIDEMLTNIDLESHKPVRDKPDKDVLQRLAIACVAYDMDEVDSAMEEITSYIYESDDGLVDWLRDNVNMMNFDEIVERLDTE